MPNGFKLCLTHFSKGTKKFLEWASPPYLRAWLRLISSHFRKCCEKNISVTVCEKVLPRLNKHDDVIEWKFMKIAPAPKWRADCARGYIYIQCYWLQCQLQKLVRADCLILRLSCRLSNSSTKSYKSIFSARTLSTESRSTLPNFSQVMEFLGNFFSNFILE